MTSCTFWQQLTLAVVWMIGAFPVAFVVVGLLLRPRRRK